MDLTSVAEVHRSITGADVLTRPTLLRTSAAMMFINHLTIIMVYATYIVFAGIMMLGSIAATQVLHLPDIMWLPIFAATVFVQMRYGYNL